MKLTKEKWGTLPSGEDVILVTLSNGSGTEIRISTYGAIITAFTTPDKNRNPVNIVLGFPEFERYVSSDYLSAYSYFGAAIGRYANRIKNAEFSIGETVFHLPQNDGTNCLHGGVSGFDKKNWSVLSVQEFPTAKVELGYISQDGEEGFPGELTVRLSFELNDKNELSLEFNATTDKTTAVNLTHHSYFNLNGGSGTILNHVVQIPASTYFEQDQQQCATGKRLPVNNSIFDFTSPRTVKQNWNEQFGYDHTFNLDHHNGKLIRAAEVSSYESGIRLEVLTTEPVVHFYAGKYIPEQSLTDKIKIGAFSGLCFETHRIPNSVNLVGEDKTILRPGESYKAKTVFRIGRI